VPPLDVNVNVEPAQIGELLPAVGVGNAFTVTVTVPVLVQPAAVVPVTVYVIVEVGLAVTVAPVVDDKPVAGLHV
jgi:hypothetical protein